MIWGILSSAVGVFDSKYKGLTVLLSGLTCLYFEISVSRMVFTVILLFYCPTGTSNTPLLSVKQWRSLKETCDVSRACITHPFRAHGHSGADKREEASYTRSLGSHLFHTL